MPDYKKSALLCIRITRVLLLVLAATLFAMPPFVKWYAVLRLLSRTASTVLLVAFYLCTVPAGTALCAIHKLLTNICADRVFLTDNARLVSRVGWCCAAVCVITAVAGCFYPALLFICLIMLFLWLLMQVVASVLSAAAALREENDLTI